MMKKVGLVIPVLAIALTGTTACATKKFVRQNVGEVNDRPFLLFSAIGLYADIIKHRDAQRKALGRKKWPENRIKR